MNPVNHKGLSGLKVREAWYEEALDDLTNTGNVPKEALRKLQRERERERETG